jgi:Immunity protein 26
MWGMAKTFKSGDIFSFPLPTGEYMTGRVMLDVKKQCVHPKLLESGSPLGSHNGDILIEVYKQTFSEPTAERSDILIPGIWTDSASVKGGFWPIIGYETIDPTQVEFPESFILYGARTIHFRKGELKLPINITHEEYDQLHILDTTRSSGTLEEVCLYCLGRKDEINDPDLVDVELRSLKRSDLRFNEFRSEAYRRLGEDENQPYFEMALKHGYDIRRFYNIDEDKKKELELNPSPLDDLDDDEFVFLCPYCLSIVGEDDKICNTCHEDMTCDAKHQLTAEQYRHQRRKSCKFCGKSILLLSSVCPYCLKWEDGTASVALAQAERSV